MTDLLRRSWRDVRDEIHQWILDRAYKPGDKFPRDEDLAEALGCARSTVQRAMKDLAEAGIVERRRKGGTHLRADPVTRATFDIPVTRLEIEARGSIYGYRLIRRAKQTTPPAVTAAFGMAAPARMLRLEALHLSDGRPWLHEDRWISPETAPEALDVDFARINANEWLVEHKPYSRCDLRFSAAKAGAHIADLMRIDPDDAVFVTERTTWLGDDPITHVTATAAPGYRLTTSI